MAMANTKGPSTMRNMMHNGRHSLLPPKCPFPSIAPSYADYISSPVIGPKGPNSRDANSHHQRASSESLLTEEQPSWLDELLNEPETPVPRGHRRSSSDSFTYMEAANAVKTGYAAQDEHKLRNLASASSWGSQDFDLYKDARNMSFYGEHNPMIINKNRTWNFSQNAPAHSTGIAASRENSILRSSSLGASQKLDGITSTAAEKQDAAESGPQDGHTSSERNDSSNNKASGSETDTKRAKQQFAQRSRVRKLQYIAELERNVQVLQAEGSGVAAELEFLNQRSLILSMENKALKQRLENLAQEQLIKYLEHEVLEREVRRLRALYQQQQQPQPQPQQPPPTQTHRRNSTWEKLDSQLANLSLKNKDSGS